MIRPALLRREPLSPIVVTIVAWSLLIGFLILLGIVGIAFAEINELLTRVSELERRSPKAGPSEDAGHVPTPDVNRHVQNFGGEMWGGSPPGSGGIDS